MISGAPWTPASGRSRSDADHPADRVLVAGRSTVEAERRGNTAKKRLAVEPVQAATVRLIFDLFQKGDGQSGPMGVKKVTEWLNENGHRTRKGARWGIGPIHKC